jgi:NAD(P)-dependent dehydrogenase (short-subunit alcohol dehydrogenase family)
LPRSALVTGGAGGIGVAIVARLEAEGYEVHVLDLATGFDVTDPAAWEDIPDVQLACLNAGVVTGSMSITDLTDEQYRRAVGVNVDGGVFGTRALARRMQPGSAIVATASLAGLTEVPGDPVYALTKHAVVGFVRSVAPQLEVRRIKFNAVCPGFVDTPMLDAAGGREVFEAAEFPLLSAEDVADAVWTAATSKDTGAAWVVQPGREPMQFRFPRIPGPRVEGQQAVLPPLPS